MTKENHSSTKFPEKTASRLLRLIICVASFVALASSCTRSIPAAYSEFADIPESGIPLDAEYEFTPVPLDSTEVGNGRFDLILVVRYSNRLKARSVILNVEEISLDDMSPDSTSVDLALFGDDGRPLGLGNYGIYEISDTLRRNISIPEGYSVTISSPMLPESTTGIKSLGLILSRSGQSAPSLRFRALQ